MNSDILKETNKFFDNIKIIVELFNAFKNKNIK